MNQITLEEGKNNSPTFMNLAMKLLGSLADDKGVIGEMEDLPGVDKMEAIERINDRMFSILETVGKGQLAFAKVTTKPVPMVSTEPNEPWYESWKEWRQGNSVNYKVPEGFIISQRLERGGQEGHYVNAGSLVKFLATHEFRVVPVGEWEPETETDLPWPSEWTKGNGERIDIPDGYTLERLEFAIQRSWVGPIKGKKLQKGISYRLVESK